MRIAAILVIVGALASRAAAQPYEVPDGAVTWHAPEECGDDHELRRRIGGYLDHAMAPGPFAIVDVARADDGIYRAELHIRAGDAIVERTVEARDCAQVIEAVALVLGMAAEAPARSAGGGDDDDDDDAIAAAGAPPSVTRTLAARVRTAADLGAIPGGGVGLDVGLAFTRGRLAVIASGRWFPRRFSTLSGTSGAGVDIGLAGGGAEACVHVTGVWACGGGEVAQMTGAGIGLVDARTNTSSWSALTAGVAGEIALGHGTRFVIEVGGYFATKRPRFVLDDGTVLYEPSLVGARLYAGVEATLF